MGYFTITTVIGLLASIVVAIIAGLILEAFFHLTGESTSLNFGGALLFDATQFVVAVVAGLIGMMGAVVGRSTAAGYVIGIMWFVVDISLGQFEWFPDSWKIISLNYTSHNLQDLIVNPAPFLSVLPYLIVVIVYLTLPVVIAAYAFRRRDMLGPS